MKKTNSNSEHCCICEEITSGQPANEITRRYRIKSRIVRTYQDFVVVPSVSPLAEGHLLVFPKQHVNRMSNLPFQQREQFVDIACELYEKLCTLYGNIYLFEHGIEGSGHVACGVYHAHLHLVPISEPMRSRIHSCIYSDYPPFRIGDLSEILYKKGHKMPYILYGSNPNSLFLGDATAMPSQYVRKLFAMNLNLEFWDWKELSGVSEFAATLTAGLR